MNSPANADELGLCLCHGCGQACDLSGGAHTCNRCGAAIHRRKANAISRGWAFLMAALVFYIPANLLPVMHTEMLGSGSDSTIGGGVLEFWEAGAWDIALIIFIASVGVPAIKFFSLGLLLYTAQRGSTWACRQRSQLYRFVELIGYWSMLDMDGARRLIGTFVEHGLRAQARSGNLITGQMFISLDFYPDAPKVAFDMAANPITIPTLPGSLEQLQEQLQRVVERIAKLPLESIAGNLDGSLRALRASLKQFNGQTLPDVKVALDEVHKTLRTANSAISEDSPQRERMGETLDELERMSRSLRDLADYLGRHPESLIRGRPKAAGAEALEP